MSKARTIANLGGGIPDPFDPVAVTGATPSLDVGSYNFFNNGTLTANTTVSFTSVPTNAKWSYHCKAANVSGAWDITTAVLRHSLSVASQESGPTGIFIKPDGSKLYVSGPAGDDINEYDLFKPWNVTSGAFLQKFSITSQDNNPRDLFFKPDGTKMYMLGGTFARVNEYNLSTAWDVSTASYLQNIAVGSVQANVEGLFFKPDGTKFYICGITGSRVSEYNLSTAWDVTTATHSQNFSVNAQETDPTAVFFKPDGTEMYVVGEGSDRVREYTLSTAWDISTASYGDNTSVSNQEVNPHGMFFHPDGTKFYITGQNSDSVHQYELGTTTQITFPLSMTVKANLLYADDIVTYDFFTTDGGTTVTLIGEDVI